jgi:hypothetical protein
MDALSLDTQTGSMFIFLACDENKRFSTSHLRAVYRFHVPILITGFLIQADRGRFLAVSHFLPSLAYPLFSFCAVYGINNPILLSRMLLFCFSIFVLWTLAARLCLYHL